MTTRVMVLMYHALYADETEREAIDPVERPYAVSVEVFRRQLDWMAAAGIPIRDPVSPSGAAAGAPVSIVLSFDDGHASNYWHAFPLLRDRGHAGVFFVTTDFIGTRRAFCEWPQLREMAGAGMHIGSHGRSHRFFDDLPTAGLEAEYSESRDAIEAGTGQTPRLISFPGGRYLREQIPAGRAAGYQLFFTSDIGANAPRAFEPGGIVRRIAIGHTTSHEAFTRIAGADSLFLARSMAIGGVKKSLRRMIGNRLYHALYERFST